MMLCTRFRFTPVALLVGLTLLLPAPGADARRRRRDKPRPGSDPAAEVYARGKQMFKDKDYVGALEAFERAHKLRPHFLVQCNIARCYERLSKMIEAAERYRRCLTDGAAATKAADKIKAALKQVEERVTWVEVASPGEGGTVYVNGQEMGPTGMPVSVNPGQVVIEVRRRGATPARASITARGGKTIKLTLVPTSLAPEVAPAPPPPVPVKPPAPPPREGLSQAWFWIATAVTVALTTTYVVTGVQALGLKSDYEKTPTRDGYDAAIDRRTLSNIFFGLAAAAAGTSTVLFFFTDFGGGRGGDRGGASGGGERGPRGDDELRVGLGLRGTF